MTSKKEFNLTEDHLKLIRAFSWGWQHCETGAPEVNPKRPFGNSYVPPDIAEILGRDWPDEDAPGDRFDDEVDDITQELMAIYRETLTALEIVCQHAGEPVTPGLYVNRAPWPYGVKWERSE